MKQKVLVANQNEMFSNDASDFNWVQKGNILGIATTGDFVNLQGERKCTTHASVVELDVDLRALVKASIVKGFGEIIKGNALEECVDEEMEDIKNAIKKIEGKVSA